jgi:transposase
MGGDKLKALLQEGLAVAARTEAMKPSDLACVVIDTTVQPKAVMFPTDAKLLNRARERLVRLTKKLGVSLRQSYARVGKLALIKHQRYAHAHQFKRANRSLRKLKTYLGRVIRDIERRIVGNEDLREAFVRPLFLARRVLEQERRQRGRKVYSLHAPEVECFGLTCAKYQSGEVDRNGRISRCGDEMMRVMLYEAAQSMLRSKKWSWLKAWAMQIARRRGMKKAIVALVRRLAVIMHRIWVDGTEFRWTREVAAA